MDSQELIKLNIDDLTEEKARIIGTDLLKEDIDLDKAIAKRNGLVSAVLTAGVIATGMDNTASYALMGADAVFLLQLVEKIQAIYKKQKTLKKFETDTYQDSYIDFIKECQEYVSKKNPNQEKTR